MIAVSFCDRRISSPRCGMFLVQGRSGIVYSGVNMAYGGSQISG